METAVELSRHIVEIFATEEELNIINKSKLYKQERMYSYEDLKEAFVEGYKQRAEKSDLIFDNASIMYAIHLFKEFKNK